jgi:hypothetical protein
MYISISGFLAFKVSFNLNTEIMAVCLSSVIAIILNGDNYRQHFSLLAAER